MSDTEDELHSARHEFVIDASFNEYDTKDAGVLVADLTNTG